MPEKRKRSRQDRRAERVDGCKQCGKPHRTRAGGPACVAHKSGQPDQACGRAPVEGARVCHTHGGAIAAVKGKALQRMALLSAEGEIADLMRKCDVPEQHPIDGLLEVVRISGVMFRLLSHKVGELKSDPTIRAIAYEKRDGGSGVEKVADDDALWGVNHLGEMVPHVYTTMLRHWGDMYARATKMALDAGIDERRLAMAEATSDGLHIAINQALDETPELTSAQRTAFGLSLATALRQMQGNPNIVEGELA